MTPQERAGLAVSVGLLLIILAVRAFIKFYKKQEAKMPMPTIMQENLNDIAAMRKFANSLYEYLKLLNQQLPTGIAQVAQEKHEIQIKILYLDSLCQIIEYAHDLRIKITQEQWADYVHHAKLIAQGKTTLPKVLGYYQELKVAKNPVKPMFPIDRTNAWDKRPMKEQRDYPPYDPS